MKYEIGQKVYMLQEYAIHIIEQEVERIILSAGETRYCLKASGSTLINESDIFTAEGIKTKLLNDLEEKHRGELSQAQREIKKIEENLDIPKKATIVKV